MSVSGRHRDLVLGPKTAHRDEIVFETAGTLAPGHAKGLELDIAIAEPDPENDFSPGHHV
jgi:hypothetical protein